LGMEDIHNLITYDLALIPTELFEKNVYNRFNSIQLT